MKFPHTYTLKHPVTIGDEVHIEVTVNKIKGKHMRGLPADPKEYNMDVMMTLATKVCGESSILFDEMDGEDVIAVCEIVGEALAGGQLTGTTA